LGGNLKPKNGTKKKKWMKKPENGMKTRNRRRNLSMSHSRIATNRLLYHLLIKDETVKDATNVTNNEIGPDAT